MPVQKTKGGNVSVFAIRSNLIGYSQRRLRDIKTSVTIITNLLVSLQKLRFGENSSSTF